MAGIQTIPNNDIVSFLPHWIHHSNFLIHVAGSHTGHLTHFITFLPTPKKQIRRSKVSKLQKLHQCQYNHGVCWSSMIETRDSARRGGTRARKLHVLLLLVPILAFKGGPRRGENDGEMGEGLFEYGTLMHFSRDSRREHVIFWWQLDYCLEWIRLWPLVSSIHDTNISSNIWIKTMEKPRIK